jgi:hypothetical protein
MADGTVEYVIRLTDKTKAGTASAVAGSRELENQTQATAEALDDLGDEAKRAGDAVDDMGDEARKAGRKVDDLGDDTKTTTRSVDGLITGLKGLVGILAVDQLIGVLTGAAEAVFDFGQEVADLRNQITDTATRSGIAAETLQGIRFAAEGAGVGFEELMTDLDNFGRMMRDASTGTGAQADAFAALQVKVDDANGSLRDVDSVFRETLAALAAMPPSAERGALALDLFGGAGGRLIQSLGGGELEDFIALARDFGVNVGPDAAKAASDWQRASAELSTVVDGLKAELFDAAGGADALFNLGEAAIYLFEVAGGYISGFVDGVVTGLGRIIAPLEAVGRAIGDVILAFQAIARGDFDAGLERLSSSMSNLGEAIRSGPAAAASLLTGGLVEGVLTGAERASTGADTAAARVARLQEARARITSRTATGAGGGNGGRGPEVDTEEVEAAATAAAEASSRVFLSGFEEDRRRLSDVLAEGARNLAEQQAKAAAEAEATRARRLEGVQTGIGVAGQVLGGDLGGGLSSIAGATGRAGLGVAGAALSGLQAIGEQGAEGIRETLEGVKDALIAALEALPQLIGDVLPQFAISLVSELIPALIRAAPQILRSILVDLPIAIANALRELIGLDRAVGRVEERVRGSEFLQNVSAVVAVATGVRREEGLEELRDRGDVGEVFGNRSARTASDGQASNARAADRLATFSTRPRRGRQPVAASNPFDQLARAYDTEYGTYGRARATTIGVRP